MRVLLSNLAIVTVLAASGTAYAASMTATGMVKAYDAKTMMLTLKNGTAYMLPQTFRDPGLKVGEKVKIVYSMAGKKHEATSVVILK